MLHGLRQLAHVALAVVPSPAPNGHDLGGNVPSKNTAVALKPTTAFDNCLSAAILDATFEPNRAHDHAWIATQDGLAQRDALQRRGQEQCLELGNCRKLQVECTLLRRRSLWQLRVVGLSCQQHGQKQPTEQEARLQSRFLTTQQGRNEEGNKIKKLKKWSF